MFAKLYFMNISNSSFFRQLGVLTSAVKNTADITRAVLHFSDNFRRRSCKWTALDARRSPQKDTHDRQKLYLLFSFYSPTRFFLCNQATGLRREPIRITKVSTNVWKVGLYYMCIVLKFIELQRLFLWHQVSVNEQNLEKIGYYVISAESRQL